jgi:hypothetical protein
VSSVLWLSITQIAATRAATSSVISSSTRPICGAQL